MTEQTSRFPRRRAKTRSSSQALPAAKRPTALISEFSSGGVVLRRIHGKVHVALLHAARTRGNVWMLPRGHIDLALGETPEQTALREVKEELGIAEVEIKRRLGIGKFQFYGQYGKVTKTVHYFLLDGKSEHLQPEDAEGILEARWMPIKQALKALTFPGERRMLLLAVRPARTPRRRPALGRRPGTPFRLARS